MRGSMQSRLLIGSRQPQYATMDWRWIQPPATCPKGSACRHRPDVRFSGCRPRPWGLGSAISASSQRRPSGGRPDILFCISDDQSWLHAGAMGDQVVRTPAFDRVAADGVVFPERVL